MDTDDDDTRRVVGVVSARDRVAAVTKDVQTAKLRIMFIINRMAAATTIAQHYDGWMAIINGPLNSLSMLQFSC